MTKKEPVKIPFACLKRRVDGSDTITYCGREIQERYEYVFPDVEYAMRHYVDDKTMQVCKNCVQVHKREKQKSEENA